MNAAIYASLFRLRDKVVFVVFAGFLSLLAFLASVPKRQGHSEVDSTLFLLFPPLILGALLAGIWNKPLQRSTSSLCPNIQLVLFRWHTRVILVAAVGWAVIAHGIEPAMPLVAAIGISSAVFTFPLLFAIGQPVRSTKYRFLAPLWGLLLGIYLGPMSIQGVGAKILSHAPLVGAFGFGLTGINLWLTRKRKPIAKVARTLPPAEEGNWRLLLGRFGGAMAERKAAARRSSRVYPARQASLLRWIRAAFEESPYGWVFGAGMVGILVIHPWVLHRAEGYPLAWYRTVFSPDPFGNTTGSMLALAVALITSSLGPGLLRTGQLYPTSRRRRATVAFASSAVSFGFNFLVIVGGSLLLACIVGWYLNLPLPVRPASEFVVRMAMVLPFMSMVRRAALRLEQSQSLVEILFLIGGVMVLLGVTQSFLLDAGLQVGALVCLTSIIASQWVYYASLRRFYTQGDLAWRGTARPTLIET